MEQVDRCLPVAVVQGVDERLRLPRGPAGATTEQQEAADGEDGDAGAADAEYLPAVQAGDDLVVAGLTVLPLLLVPLLGLAVLPLLGLSPLWRCLPALWRCLALRLPLAGLALTTLAPRGLSTLWLALSRLPALGLALPGLPLSLSRLAALWLAAAGLPTLLRLPTLWLALLGLSTLWVLLWLAAVLVTALGMLCALVALDALSILAAPQVVAERHPTRVTHGCSRFDSRSAVRTLCHTTLFLITVIKLLLLSAIRAADVRGPADWVTPPNRR